MNPVLSYHWSEPLPPRLHFAACHIPRAFRSLVGLLDATDTAARRWELSCSSLDSPQHLVQVRCTPRSPSESERPLCTQRRSGPRLWGTFQTVFLDCSSKWNDWRKCFWCLHLTVKYLWEENYRIYSNSKTCLLKKVFNMQHKTILKKRKKAKKKILLNNLTQNKKTSYLSDKRRVENKKQTTA